MFDIGFSELMVIAIVALVVIGPERLPKVARTAGLLFGRFQRYVNTVKADINREIQLDELKQLQADMQDSARSIERSLNSEMLSLEQSVQSVFKVPEPVPNEVAEHSADPVSNVTNADLDAVALSDVAEPLAAPLVSAAAQEPGSAPASANTTSKG